MWKPRGAGLESKKPSTTPSPRIRRSAGGNFRPARAQSRAQHWGQALVFSRLARRGSPAPIRPRIASLRAPLGADYRVSRGNAGQHGGGMRDTWQGWLIRSACFIAFLHGEGLGGGRLSGSFHASLRSGATQTPARGMHLRTWDDMLQRVCTEACVADTQSQTD